MMSATLKYTEGNTEVKHQSRHTRSDLSQAHQAFEKGSIEMIRNTQPSEGKSEKT